MLKILLKVILVLLTVVGLVVFFGWCQFRKEFAEPSLAGTLERVTLPVGGRSRTFAYYWPAKAVANPALVFALHGSSGNGVQLRKFSRYQFDRLADREGFIVVYPDGYKGYWNDCRRSADYAANTENIDDPAFFGAMIDDLVQRLRADRNRVFAFGISNGGHMVYRLALEMPQRFAALAAVAANMPVPENLDCTPAKQPVSIAIVNGTNDPINPYGGGEVKLLGNTSRGRVLSTSASAAYWAELAGVESAPIVTQLPENDGDPGTHVRRETWRGRAGVQVRVYTLEGSGHVLPAQSPSVFERVVGGSAADLDAAPELWEFFTVAGSAGSAPKTAASAAP